MVATLRPVAFHAGRLRRKIVQRIAVTEIRQIVTRPDLDFTAMTAGEAGAPLVLLLHGASESFHIWRAQVPALADTGYFAVAPSQRGYSRGARPDPGDSSHYTVDKLVADAVEI